MNNNKDNHLKSGDNMKFNYLTFGIVFLTNVSFFSSSFAAQPAENKSCLDSAITEGDMNECSEKDFKSADNELNQVYKSIQTKFKKDPLFLKKLKIAQLAWIQFRDAQFDMKYPHKDEDGYYGSVFSMCIANYKAQLTRERIKSLKEWLTAAPEGDVCSGSLQI